MNRLLDTFTCWVSHFCNDTHHSTCKTFIMTLNRPKKAFFRHPHFYKTRLHTFFASRTDLVSSSQTGLLKFPCKRERSERELLTSFDKKGIWKGRKKHVWIGRFGERGATTLTNDEGCRQIRPGWCLVFGGWGGGGLRREAFNLTWTVMSCLWMGGVDGNSLWQSVQTVVNVCFLTIHYRLLNKFNSVQFNFQFTSFDFSK